MRGSLDNETLLHIPNQRRPVLSEMAESGNSNRGVALDGELLLARFHQREISREPASGASVPCGEAHFVGAHGGLGVMEGARHRH